jgi:energy-coupling factor transporter transmembrane protein EcfT
MAQKLTLRYIPSDSPLHRFDTRCKLLALCSCSIGILHMSGMGLGAFGALLVVLTLTLGRWKGTVFRAIRGWVPFLLVLFAVQAFSLEPGSRPIPFIPATEARLQIAVISCWRLATLLAYATLFTMVTSPRQLERAVGQTLQLFPFVPARRISMMVSLTLRFLPLLLHQAEEVRLAFRSRLGGKRRNPLDRLRFYAVPILRKSLDRAEELAYALAARGYRDDLVIPAEPVPLVHIAVVVGWIGITVIGVWIS